MPVEVMPLAGLHVSKLFQPRSGGLIIDTVAEYAARARAGDKFPPLLAYRVADRKFPGPVLVAGFHRHAAYQKAGIEAVEVDIHEGSYREAWLAGYLSNVINGLRYTNEDKRKAVEVGLSHFAHESAPVIAERLKVSDELVRKVRKELIAEGKIQEPENVLRKDGSSYPVTIQHSNNLDNGCPTVGDAETVNGTASPGSSAPEPLPAPPEPDECDEFVGRVNQVCHALDEAKATVLRLAAESYGRHIHAESVTLQIDAARKALWQSRPTELCNCAKAGTPAADCKACFGSGRCPASRVLKGVR